MISKKMEGNRELGNPQQQHTKSMIILLVDKAQGEGHYRFKPILTIHYSGLSHRDKLFESVPASRLNIHLLILNHLEVDCLQEHQ